MKARFSSGSGLYPPFRPSWSSYFPPLPCPPQQITSGAARDVGQGAVLCDAAAAFAYSTAEERRAASEPVGGGWEARRKAPVRVKGKRGDESACVLRISLPGVISNLLFFHLLPSMRASRMHLFAHASSRPHPCRRAAGSQGPSDGETVLRERNSGSYDGPQIQNGPHRHG